MANKNSSELEREVEAYREARGPDQPSLFAAEEAPATVPMVRGPGRPPGARNLRAEEDAAAVRAMLARDPRYASTQGDPFIAATKIGALDMLVADNVVFLAELWGCTRSEAVDKWARINGSIQEMHRAKLARVEIVPEGAVGGAPLDFGGDRRRAALEDGAIDAEFEDVPPAGEDEGG